MIICTPPSLRKDQSPSRQSYKCSIQSPGSHSYIQLRKILNQVKKQKQVLFQQLINKQKLNTQLVRKVSELENKIKQLQQHNKRFVILKRSSRSLIEKDLINCQQQQSLKNLREQFLPILKGTQNQIDQKIQISFSKNITNFQRPRKVNTQESDSTLLINFQDQEISIEQSSKNTSTFVKSVINPSENHYSQDTIQMSQKLANLESQKRINQIIYLLQNNSDLHSQLQKLKRQNIEKDQIIKNLNQTMNQVYYQFNQTKLFLQKLNTSVTQGQTIFQKTQNSNVKDLTRSIDKIKSNNSNQFDLNYSIVQKNQQSRSVICLQIYNKLKKLFQNNKIYSINYEQ